MDNDLGRMAEIVDRWTEIAQGRVPPLNLERGEEAFDHSIVPTVSPPAHAADHVALSEHRLVRGAGVLHAAIVSMLVRNCPFVLV